jgi:predicted protein tyrosine phosphatase
MPTASGASAFKIMPYGAALEFCPAPDTNNVFIRITNPRREFDELRYRDRFRAVLQLQFHDYTDAQVARDEIVEADRPAKLFDDGDAEAVVDFFVAHADCELMAIHCGAGKSRSAAVGVGWCLFRGDGQGLHYILNSGEYWPNPYIVGVLRRCLQRRGLIP